MRAVLWDMDGTLIDSADYHFESWVDALRPEGLSMTRDQFLSTFGWRNDRILHHLIGPDLEPERVTRIADAKEVGYRRFVRDRGLHPLAGAASWIVRLHREGWRQAIASSAPRANVEVALEVLAWTPFFDAFVSGDEVSAGKPDPQIFLTAAGRLAVPPAQCIVVEDAAAGIQAARRGGMRCIGVGPAAAGERPDISVPSLDSLPPDAFSRLLDAGTAF
jgi:beta-phosphoglucomutase